MATAAPAGAGSLTPAEIAEGLRRGGAAANRAMRFLFDQHRATIERSAFRANCPESILDDIVQDTLINYMRHIRSGEDVAAPGAYLARIARNLVVDHFRRRKPDDSLEQAIESGALGSDEESHRPRPDQCLEIAAENDCYRAAYLAFRQDFPEPGEVFLLQVYEGMSTRQLADHLGKNHGAAREYISRWRTRLREYLRRHCGEDAGSA